MTGFIRFSNRVLGVIRDIAYMCSHREKATYFTRSTAKMSFVQLVAFIASLPKASMQAEVNRFLKCMGSRENIRRQSLTEARFKLSYTAFVELNDLVASDGYEDGYKTVHGFRPIAVDGSVFDMPSIAARDFGTQKTAGEDVAKARAVALVDVANDIILASDLYEYAEDERTIASKLIENFFKKGHNKNDLFLHDRGFPSTGLITKLETLSAKYLFRVSSNFLKAVNEANKTDQLIEIKDSNGEPLTVRVVNVILPNGTIEKLLTNVLDDTYTPEHFRELYNCRWGIEVKYRELKSRLEIENLTAGHTLLVWQDFFATVFIANMISLAKHTAAKQVEQYNKAKERKYEYKINGNLAIATVRPAFIEAMLEENPRIRDKLMQNAIDMIARELLPIRPDRPSNKRVVKNKSARFPMNKKGNR